MLSHFFMIIFCSEEYELTSTLVVTVLSTDMSLDSTYNNKS